MKSNYKLKLFTAMVVFGISLGNAIAFTPILTPPTIHTENSDNWVKVQDRNGIIIYFSEYQSNGKSYLNVKFENTFNETVDFSWSLSKKNEPIVSNSLTKIAALTSKNLTENYLLIPFNDDDSYADYSINIQVK